MMSFSKNNRLTHASLLSSCLLLLILYRFTAPSGTTPEDASEFILTAQFLGLPHPPGYPLFVWIGHFFSLLPLGSPAQQIAFVSHLSIALTSGILGYWTLQRTTNWVLAVWMIFTYGLSTFNWSSAQFVEVYPLHTFLMTLTFFLFYQLTQILDCTAHKWLIFFTGLALGFSLSNHYPLVVLTFPGLLFFLHSNKENLLNSTFFTFFSLGLLMGLAPYSYLFFAKDFSDFLFLGPIYNWSVFFDYVLRKEYAQIDKTSVFSFYKFLQYSLLGITMMVQSFTPLVFLSFIVSMIQLAKHEIEKSWAIPLLLGMISSFFLLFLFWQPDYYLLAIELYQSFHGFAFACLILLALSPIQKVLADNRWQKKLVVLLACIPVVLFILNFKNNDRRTDTFTKDFSEIVFSSVPPNSVLLVKGDVDAGILAYYHFLEGKRPDINLVSQAATLLPNKLFDRNFDIPKNNHRVALLNFISANLSSKKPIFSFGPVAHFSPNQVPFPMSTRDYGLYKEIYDGTPPPERDLTVIKTKTIEFLDKALSISFEPNFVHYRDLLFASACHFLLISGIEHPAFEKIPRCQLIKAQWLHVEKKDYFQADRFFLAGLKGLSNRSKSEKVDIGKDFFINRMKMMELPSGSESQDKMTLVKETIDITLPLAVQFPICQNSLARKVYDLSLKNGFALEAQELKTTFSHCPIETVPQPI